jgi:WS/DGAT/MGAT family acyltransferase
MSAAERSSEPMSNVDAAWLHMDTPTNLAVITGVMTFEQPLDYERLCEIFEKRMLIYQRFRQRVRATSLPFSGLRWEIDPNFDIHSHLHRVAVPAPGDERALQALVGDLMSQPLDPTKPLWHYYLVENYGAGSALIGRLHHAIADGIALMQVLLSMADEDPNAVWTDAQVEAHPRLSPLARLMLPVVQAARAADRAWKSAGALARDGFGFVTSPDRMIGAAGVGLSLTAGLAKLLLLPPDRKTVFRGQCRVPKAAAWSEPLDLQEVKAVGKMVDATINDVLLTCVTGALRRYMESRSESTAGVNIRAVVPVNLRRPNEIEKLGNRFGLVFLALPVGIRDLGKRLVVLKRRMDDIKSSSEAVVAFGILNTIGMTPSVIEDIVIKIFGMKGTAVMTNVPGPRNPLYMAGSRIKTIMFWVPSPGNLGMGVSILSYAEQVIVGITTDTALVPDPHTIAQAFQTEFEEMKVWAREASRPSRQRPVYQETGLPLEDDLGPFGKSAQPDLEPATAAWAETAPVEPDPPGPVESVLETALETVADALQARTKTAETSLDPEQRCTAMTRSGERCKNKPLPGSTTCRRHTQA